MSSAALRTAALREQVAALKKSGDLRVVNQALLSSLCASAKAAKVRTDVKCEVAVAVLEVMSRARVTHAKEHLPGLFTRAAELASRKARGRPAVEGNHLGSAVFAGGVYYREAMKDRHCMASIGVFVEASRGYLRGASPSAASTAQIAVGLTKLHNAPNVDATLTQSYLRRALQSETLHSIASKPSLTLAIGLIEGAAHHKLKEEARPYLLKVLNHLKQTKKILVDVFCRIVWAAVVLGEKNMQMLDLAKRVEVVPKRANSSELKKVAKMMWAVAEMARSGQNIFRAQSSSSSGLSNSAKSLHDAVQIAENSVANFITKRQDGAHLNEISQIAYESTRTLQALSATPLVQIALPQHMASVVSKNVFTLVATPTECYPKMFYAYTAAMSSVDDIPNFIPMVSSAIKGGYKSSVICLASAALLRRFENETKALRASIFTIVVEALLEGRHLMHQNLAIITQLCVCLPPTQQNEVQRRQIDSILSNLIYTLTASTPYQDSLLLLRTIHRAENHRNEREISLIVNSLMQNVSFQPNRYVILMQTLGLLAKNNRAQNEVISLLETLKERGPIFGVTWGDTLRVFLEDEDRGKELPGWIEWQFEVPRVGCDYAILEMMLRVYCDAKTCPTLEQNRPQEDRDAVVWSAFSSSVLSTQKLLGGAPRHLASIVRRCRRQSSEKQRLIGILERKVVVENVEGAEEEEEEEGEEVQKTVSLPWHL